MRFCAAMSQYPDPKGSFTFILLELLFKLMKIAFFFFCWALILLHKLYGYIVAQTKNFSLRYAFSFFIATLAFPIFIGIYNIPLIIEPISTNMAIILSISILYTYKESVSKYIKFRGIFSILLYWTLSTYTLANIMLLKLKKTIFFNSFGELDIWFPVLQIRSQILELSNKYPALVGKHSDNGAFSIMTKPHSWFIDGVSLWLIVLTFIVGSLLITYSAMSSEKKVNSNYLINTCIIHFIIVCTVSCFLTSSYFLFFLMFEAMLIPISILILINGSRRESIRAVKFLVIYTITGSMFLWYSVAYFISFFGSTNYNILSTLFENAQSSGSSFIFLILFIGFAFKVPLVPFHSWLLTAHVEAPTIGSVILAALSLKIGGYGMYRFVYGLFPYEAYSFKEEIIAIALFGFTITSIDACRQNDLKRFVALTSISHMNFSIIGLFSGNIWGFYGFIHTMLSHGIIASGLFIVIGHIYGCSSKRDILRLGGLAKIAPSTASSLIFFLLANMGLPGLSAFPGEFYTIVALVHLDILYLLYVFPGYIFTGIYSLVVITKVIWGEPTYLKKIYDLSYGAKTSLTILSVFSVLLGIFPDIIFSTIEI